MGASGSVGGAAETKGHELVNAVLAQQWEEVTSILEKCGNKIDLTVRDPEMDGTALIWASALKHPETVQKLLEMGADPNLQTTDGRSCMHTAAIGNQVEMLGMMKKANCNTELATVDGLTALMAACQYGCAEAVAKLIEIGAENEAAANDCRSPLHCACEEGSVKVVKILLASGCEPNFTNSGGGTPLHVACMNGHMKIVQELLQNGASLDSRTKAGMTPFHVAAMFGHTKVALELIKHKVDVNAKRHDGQTALHLTCKKSRTKTIVALAENGASWDIQDQQGNTPLAYAATFLLQDLWQSHRIVEAKEFSESGTKKEQPILPGSSLPTAYTKFDEGLTRAPRMEFRSPVSKSRKLGEKGPGAASAGGTRRLGDRKKLVRETSAGSFAVHKKTDRLMSGGSESPSNEGGVSGKIGQGAGSGSGEKTSSKRWSPQQIGRRLKVKWNSPANVTRRIAKISQGASSD